MLKVESFRARKILARTTMAVLLAFAAFAVFSALKPPGWPGDYPLPEYLPLAEQVAELPVVLRTACDGLPYPDSTGMPYGLPLADPGWVVTGAVICPWATTSVETRARAVEARGGEVVVARPSRVRDIDLPEVVAALTEPEDRSIPFLETGCDMIAYQHPATALTTSTGEQHLVRVPVGLCGDSEASTTLLAAYEAGSRTTVTGTAS